MNHYSRKSEGSCILENPRKNCQRRFLGKILSFFFFFVFFFFPTEVFATMAVDCYRSGTKVGILQVFNQSPWSSDWLVSGSNVRFQFFANETSEVQNNEVSFKLGSSSWIPASEIGYGLHSPYAVEIGLGYERCGYVWGSVRWRSSQDGQLNYCNLKMTKYDTGPVFNDFINPSCITSTCSNSSNPLARAMVVNGEIRFSDPSCESYYYYLNSNQFSFLRSFSGYCFSFGGGIISPNGSISFNVNPLPPSGFTTAQADLKTYNYINETTCGTPVTPTPTPTATPVVKRICKKVTGYVKNKATGKGIRGARVTAHGVDNSVGNCQGKHYACSAVTTNSNGYFEISCANVSDANTKCLGVYETNKVGFTDAYGATGPTGSSVWNNNTIMLNNPQSSTCGTFNFWDKK